MSSFSGINFVPLSEGSFIGSILNDDLGFDGFVISDYNAINFCANQELPTSFGKMNKN
jgi:beta-glucosidase-like glycosyl hydrolase